MISHSNKEENRSQRPEESSGILRKMARSVRRLVRSCATSLLPELRELGEPLDWKQLKIVLVDSTVSPTARVYCPSLIVRSSVGDYTYITRGAVIYSTSIGRFCSIGPNLSCGWGIHPVDALTTAPMFYSTERQNGVSLSETNKIAETERICIGNDVFIGMNVTILDGVNIGDGAIIGAGAVVAKDVPPYAIAYGNPLHVSRYRFPEGQREALLRIRWWEWDFSKLKEVEELFFNVEEFIRRHDSKPSSDG